MKFVTRQIAITVSLLAVNSVVCADCPKFLLVKKTGVLQSNLIKEASGLAASRKNHDVLWTHNDSGDLARIYAINTKGSLLGIYNFPGADARDWEDIAIGPGPDPNKDYIYVGDIGDNVAHRESVIVYRIAEPTVDTNQSPVQTLTGFDTIRLKYPEKPVNAETLMVEPLTKDIYIISKEKKRSRLYRAAYPQSTTGTTIMEYKSELALGKVTGGDISPDGSMIIIRSYQNASIWIKPVGINLWDAFKTRGCNIPLVAELQGEAICFAGNGKGYYTLSEKPYQPIYYFAPDID